MAEKAPVRELRCDCGYVAHGGDDDELVAAVQAHAERVHDMKLSAELVLVLAQTKDVTTGRAAPEVGPRGASVWSPTTRRLP